MAPKTSFKWGEIAARLRSYCCWGEREQYQGFCPEVETIKISGGGHTAKHLHHAFHSFFFFFLKNQQNGKNMYTIVCIIFFGGSPENCNTLIETNIAPENTHLEKEIPIGNHHF